MANESKRNPNTVYFIDSRIMMPQTFVESGFVLDVNEERGRFTVAVYHDDYRSFSISDYGQLVFSTREEAEDVVRRLPVVGQTVYCVARKTNKVTENVVEYFDIPNVYFKNGDYISVTEMGHSLFMSKHEALAAL